MMRHFMLILFGQCFLLLSAAGQTPYQVRGRVVDEKDHPLPGAAVLLMPDREATSTGRMGTITARDGSFSLEVVTAGRHLLQVSFLGFRSHTDTILVRSDAYLEIRLEPRMQTLQEVVVTGDYEGIRQREAPLNMEFAGREFLKMHQGGSLMETLERLPGVGAISIGSGQSKPVIRGLSFHRVAVVENGIKHEGQQWGTEHGLEIDQYAVDRAEVIKGPSSLMYGSDAVGGVVELKKADIPQPLTMGGSLDISGRSNNGLLGGSASLFGRKEKLYFTLRGTLIRYGDYRVPADSVDVYSYRVPLYRSRLRNTAGDEGAFHLESGWAGNRFTSRFFFSRLETRNGFFANAHGLEPRGVDTELHDRSSRDILHPFHSVKHWKVVNRSVWRRENRTVEGELGFQANDREEWSQYVNHGYMPPVFPDSLPFPQALERKFNKHIYTGNLRAVFNTAGGLDISAGFQAEKQVNRTGGRGFIIPDFDQFRSGAFLLMKQDFLEKSSLSAGLRLDLGRITTGEYRDWFPSPAVDGLDTVMVRLRRSPRLTRDFHSLTWSLGYNLNLEHLIFKVHAGKSFRMPVAKELAANGVNYHHFSYEVGDPDLSPETACQLDAGLEWHMRRLAVGVTPFLGYFPNYIYLNPGYAHDRLYGSGNQVFRYTQSQVFRYGGEVHSHYQLFRSLRLGLIGEYLYSIQLTGDKEGFGLPFSPPASLLLHAGYSGSRFWIFSEPYALLDLRLVSAQNRIVPPEEKTPGYGIIHIGTGGKIRIGEQAVSVSIQVKNLFNRTYFDHTGYYRLINVPGPGRNMTVHVSIPFTGPVNQQKTEHFKDQYHE